MVSLVVKTSTQVLILDLESVGESADDLVSALRAAGSQSMVVLLEAFESDDNRVSRVGALAHEAMPTSSVVRHLELKPERPERAPSVLRDIKGAALG